MAKKTGILSMQRIRNYGSFLQAYGLKQILEDLGSEVQFVDYHPGETLITSEEGTGLNRKISKVRNALIQGGPITEKFRFIRHKRNFAKNTYAYLGITQEWNYSPELDLLIVGSDEVFNCVQSNTNVGFSPELFGQKQKARTRISYAASFGNTTLEKLKEHGVDSVIADWLMEFDALSVRDKNSGEIVKALTGRQPLYHLDPVLIYDFVSQCKKQPDNVPKDKAYLLLYGYPGRFTKEECLTIRKYADSKRLKIICIGGLQACCDRFIDAGPFEVISYFLNADCIVTDTFHGTILSVITHRQFVSMVRESGYSNSQKMTDLMERLELRDRRLSSIDELEKIEERIEYEKTDQIIAAERMRTREYFQMYL